MSYDYSSRQSKQQKILQQGYISNPNEPLDDVLADSPMAHKIILADECSDMRRQFRALADELRKNF
jgi:hypothetical protein